MGISKGGYRVANHAQRYHSLVLVKRCRKNTRRIIEVGLPAVGSSSLAAALPCPLMADCEVFVNAISVS
jgi:hypothetical protein